MPRPMLPSPRKAMVVTCSCCQNTFVSKTILVLHGLGATAAVWSGVRQAIEQRSLGRVIAPDLAGHGGSAWQSHYTVGGHAAEVAELVRGTQTLFVIGHSLGAYIGLALASRWFGVEV